MVVEDVHDVRVVLAQVLGLSRGGEGLGPDRLESHEQAAATALGHQGEEFGVIDHVERCASQPPLPQFGELAEKLFGMLPVADQVRVEEENDLARQRFHFLDYVADRAADVAAVKSMADAEIALVGTTPAHFHRTPAKIVAAMNAGAVGRHDQLGVEGEGVLIHAIETAGGKIAEEPGPASLRVAADNRIGMAETFLASQGGMHAAEDDRGAPGPESLRDLEGPRGGAGDGRNADQVCWSREVRIFHHLVDDPDRGAQFRGDQRLEGGHGERRVAEVPAVDSRGAAVKIVLRMDEKNLHGGDPSCSRRNPHTVHATGRANGLSTINAAAKTASRTTSDQARKAVA